ncbi:hypothetical protein BO70DRAFT_210971 [Aspergillus heteromorphus CBS 117.55]|uniref:Uncharacterized protein n=1 Tax=Aspergillus heteromorphus CBS 117.55 TaxID=1448321 RepID=A0A317WM82_9EURO|nr:uncharacterized protein BO70DRAFT_210971 [Aspergillus heteromorphus CBS 117.55]PWY86811.1 hypothetical protein BO70DRAFT_210971 [Aspergillus heteromorphus CBS 117.55]
MIGGAVCDRIDRQNNNAAGQQQSLLVEPRLLFFFPLLVVIGANPSCFIVTIFDDFLATSRALNFPSVANLMGEVATLPPPQLETAAWDDGTPRK